MIALAAIMSYYFGSGKKRKKEAVARAMVERAWSLAGEVEEEREKLEVTAPQVALDLTEVRGIGPKRVERLKGAGINDVKDLAESNPCAIAKDLGF